MADPVIRAERLNHWYGNVVALNDVTLEIGPGITGLLGPNGAGKTTLMRAVVGLMRPAAGAVRVLGRDPWNNPAHNREIGHCPEHDGFHEWMAGGDYLRWLLRLRGHAPAEADSLADRALDRVRLSDVAGRAVGTYSRGMRQRLKIAQAVAHEPRLLILDEPLTGTDPLVRQELIQLIRSLAAEGRHVVVSSHVLHEIEQLTSAIVVIHRGRVVAFGRRDEIRALIDTHPHAVRIRTTKPRELAAALAGEESVVDLSFHPDGLSVRTPRPDAFYSRFPAVALAVGAEVEELSSPDDSLEAVFRYLTAR